MRVNGETKAQMEYAQAVKDNGGVSLKEGESRDTSQDQPWEYEDKPYTDNYVLITTAIWMLPKLIVFLPVMLILNVVPVVLCRFFMAMMPEPMDRVQRNPVFYAWFTIVLICSLPAMLVIVLSYLLDSIVYYLFSILFCTFTCQWAQAMSNFERIRPFRGGPSIITHSTDIMCCIMGQSMRQGLLEIVYMVSMMWVLIPWLKYYICCNPFIYNLDHRLVQQISTGMKDLGDLASECRSDGKGVEEVAHECRNVISRARNSRERRHRVDLWSFVPHYPYPPPGRKHSFGMQAGGSAYPAKFTLLVNVTHADIKTKGGNQEQFVLSNSIERPVYRVMLWYSNPFHFLTGWVEASISTGMPSQPRKALGGEHPMWLVTGKTQLTSGRDSYTGSGMIDWFFDYWLPVFVHEIRYAIKLKHLLATDKAYSEEANKEAKAAYIEAQSQEEKAKKDLAEAGDDENKKKEAETSVENAAKLVAARQEVWEKTRWKSAKKIAEEYADSRYQQVLSKDGISAALEEKIGLHLYGDDATLSIYRQQGEKDHKDSWQAFDDRMGDCNKLGCIARKHEDGEDSCLLRPDVNDEDREEGNPMVYPETPHGGLSQTLKKHWVD